MGAIGCLAHWLDGTVAVSAPQELATLSSAASERDPWIAADGLSLYFARNPGTQGMSDVYRAIRTSAAQPFGNAAALVNLDRSDADDGRPALTASADGCELYFSSTRNGNNYNLYVAQIAP